MADNQFQDTVGSLFKGMDGFLSTKTVVGEPMKVDDTIIIPLADVSFGVGAGVFAQDKKNNGGGGIGGKIEPTALLIISNGTTKVVNIRDTDSINKIINMVPDVMNKVTSFFSGNDDAAEEIIEEYDENMGE